MIILIAIATFIVSAFVLHCVLVFWRPLTKRDWTKLDYLANLVAAVAIVTAAIDFNYYNGSLRLREAVADYATDLTELRDAISGTVTYCEDNLHLKEVRNSSTCKYGPAFLADLERMKSEPAYPLVDLLIFEYDRATLDLYTGTPCDLGNELFKEKLTQPVYHGKWLHTQRIEFCEFYRQVLERRQEAYAAKASVETFAKFKALSGLWIVLFAFVLALRLTKVAAEIAAWPRAEAAARSGPTT